MSNKLDAVIRETKQEYTTISDEIAETILKAANAATDFESFERELGRLIVSWAPDKLAFNIAMAACKARMRGYAEG